MNVKSATKAESSTNALSLLERRLSALMREAQAGDKTAYRSLLEQVETMARSYISHSLSRAGIPPLGRAKDVLQEALIAIHRKRASYDPEQCFLPWMYAIVRYKLIDNLRSGNRYRAQVSLDQPAALQVATREAETGTELDVESLLALLPEKQRQVLGLVKLEGLSIAETADRTGYSPSDVKVSVHRALQSLRKRLGRNHEDE